MTDTITYTTPPGIHPDVDGKTYTDGRPITLPDGRHAVDFGRHLIGGQMRTLAITYATRPDLADLVRQYYHARRRPVAPGLDTLDRTADRLARAQDAYDRASISGYPVAEAAALDAARLSHHAACIRYPMAAHVRRAEYYASADHDVMASIGRSAINKMRNGQDYAQVIADMEANWSAAAEKLTENA